MCDRGLSLVTGLVERMVEKYTILFDSKKCPLSPPSVGLPMNFVHADLSHEYDRKIMPAFECKISELWQEKQREIPSIYNGSKFRLQDVTETCGSVLIKFGITCYKDFQCTNMQADSCESLEEYGLRKYNDRHACMANPVFNSVVVESSDRCIVMFKRSTMVGESPGMIDIPGGHLEPNEVDKDESLNNMDPKDVVKELYYSAVREVRDEVNLPETSLSWPSLLGIIRNNTIGGKPGACFYMKCSCSSEEIKNYYKEGGPESFESTELFIVKLKDLFEENSPWLREFSKSLTITAHAVFELYKPYYEA